MYNATLRVFTTKWGTSSATQHLRGNHQAKQWGQVNQLNKKDAWLLTPNVPQTVNHPHMHWRKQRIIKNTCIIPSRTVCRLEFSAGRAAGVLRSTHRRPKPKMLQLPLTSHNKTRLGRHLAMIQSIGGFVSLLSLWEGRNSMGMGKVVSVLTLLD